MGKTEVISRTLYGGEVKILFYPNSHRYKLDGEKSYITSVTAITGVIDKSRVLMRWAANVNADFLKQYVENAPSGTYDAAALLEMIEQSREQYEVKRDEAASIGSQVHDWAQAFALAKGTGMALPMLPESADQRVLAGIHAFLDWFNSHDVQFLAVESLVYSREHDYVGTFDLYAKIDGKLSLGDYKTGSGVYSEHRYQLSGYWMAHEEEHGSGIEQALILHFDKATGAFEVHTLDRAEHEKNRIVFLAALAIKEREKELAAEWRESKKSLEKV